MALSHTIKLMELSDAKIAQLTSDSGASPAYSASVDLPGITKITLSPKADMKKLYGDSALLDVYQKTTEVELDIECSLLSLDALKVMMGGTVTDAGTTPSQTTTYSLQATNSTPPYFKLEGQWTYAGDGIGDGHVVLYKCKVTDPPQIDLNDASGNYGTVKFKAIALPATSNGKWFDLVLNETKTAIS
ncbi:major tail protein [Effusibacillus dendaii]|uniref:Phage tail protein n=1 Tax=Effusibacillus dendaii TaxID=2743772 RepID=A0A7I8DEW7_9BACL|nr:hypothetical protein [Effusibacillus dendaii]BCJ86451.1 hypothetical protein skT53_14360 [Effusibacillus dendaii]